MKPRLVRPGESQTKPQPVAGSLADAFWTPLRWLRDTVALLGGAALLGWLVVHLTR